MSQSVHIAHPQHAPTHPQYTSTRAYETPQLPRLQFAYQHDVAYAVKQALMSKTMRRPGIEPGSFAIAIWKANMLTTAPAAHPVIRVLQQQSSLSAAVTSPLQAYPTHTQYCYLHTTPALCMYGD